MAPVSMSCFIIRVNVFSRICKECNARTHSLSTTDANVEEEEEEEEEGDFGAAAWGEEGDAAEEAVEELC